MEGYAIKWDSFAKEVDGYTEVFRRGAFKQSITYNNQKAYVEHHTHKPIADTLKLSEDDIGLRYEMNVTDEETIERILNGELNKVSIQFKPYAHQQIGNVHEVLAATLIEISLTSNPAYEDTEVNVRQKTSKLDRTPPI